MKTKRILSLLLTLAMLLTLTACGGASKGVAMMDAAAPQAPAAEMAAPNRLTSNSSAGSAVLPENRKWIVTVDMSVETDDLDAMLSALDEQILGMNGYVEDQNVHNGSNYAARRYRNANLTVRIPAADVDRFTQDVSGICNVVNTGISKEDVTLRYVDVESRKIALETEEARLLELMAQAETMSDLLEIEGRLTEVRYQLESAASQLRTYDNQIDYANIYLHIEEVQEYTPVAEKTVWQRITDGFGDSLEDLGNSLVDLFVWLIVSSPFLLVYGALIAVIYLLIRKRSKKRPPKTPKNNAPWNKPKTPDETT